MPTTIQTEDFPGIVIDSSQSGASQQLNFNFKKFCEGGSNVLSQVECIIQGRLNWTFLERNLELTTIDVAYYHQASCSFTQDCPMACSSLQLWEVSGGSLNTLLSFVYITEGTYFRTLPQGDSLPATNVTFPTVPYDVIVGDTTPIAVNSSIYTNASALALFNDSSCLYLGGPGANPPVLSSENVALAARIENFFNTDYSIANPNTHQARTFFYYNLQATLIYTY